MDSKEAMGNRMAQVSVKIASSWELHYLHVYHGCLYPHLPPPGNRKKHPNLHNLALDNNTIKVVLCPSPEPSLGK